MIRAALGYKNICNFSVIPVGNDKKPLISWAEYQKRQATDDEIKKWWTDFPKANIGIVTGKISNLAVVDIDNEEGKEAIQQYIPDSLVMPVAITAGGGQHLYFRMPPDVDLKNNSRLVPGCDLRAEGGYVIAPPSKITKGAYRWLEGCKPGKLAIPVLPQLYLSHVLMPLNKKDSLYYNNLSYRENVTLSVTLFENGRRDNDLFHIANVLSKGGMPESEILQVLETIAKSWGEEHKKEWFEDKIKSAIKRKEHREINLTREVETWVSVTNGIFSVTECYNELQGVTGVTKRNNYRVILNRLKHQGVIEKAGNKDGVFRRVEHIAEKIDWENATDEDVKLFWPFEIEEYVKTYPKNIIVIGGASNAGKTAFLLNFCNLNADKKDIFYFSSEMGAIELKQRIVKFENKENFKKINFYERASNFADIIKPDKINIIDYLEITEDFYLVARFLKDIFDKLTTGVAIVALQKKPGQQIAVGGHGSLEKARLYLAMDSGRIEIVKGKNWAQEGINPNGLVYNFKLYQGCKFSNADFKDWHEEDKKQTIGR